MGQRLGKNKKLLVVRQDRFERAERDLFVLIDKNKFTVRDFTPFGLSIYTKEPLPVDNILNVAMLVDDTIVSYVDLKFVRHGCNELGESFSAYKITSDPLDLTQINAAIKTHELLKRLPTGEMFRMIPDEFAITTFQMKEWLGKLQKEINAIQPKSFEQTEAERHSFENTVSQIVANELANSLPHWFGKLSSSIKNTGKEETQASFKFFREHIGQFLYLSYYSHRAFSKPLGYAGDYEMMNTVYQKELRGDSLFGKCVHAYFTEVPEATAVRNRAAYLLEKLKKTLSEKNGNCKILAVASGPAKELQDLIKYCPELINDKTEIHLLDQDLGALQYSQKKLNYLLAQSSLDLNIELHQTSIKDIVADGFHQDDFDLIYSAGLFDYLSDPVATFSAKRLFSALKSGGDLIIGNFNKGIPNEFGMTLIMDWHLLYRSRDDMKNIFSEITGDLDVEEEPEGINLFAVLRK